MEAATAGPRATGIPELSAGSGVVVSRGEVLWPAQDPARRHESGGQRVLSDGTNGPIRLDTVAIASDCSEERRYNPRARYETRRDPRIRNEARALPGLVAHRRWRNGRGVSRGRYATWSNGRDQNRVRPLASWSRTAGEVQDRSRSDRRPR